jgi:phage FluMu protein Com
VPRIRPDGLVECPDCQTLNESKGFEWPPERAPDAMRCRRCDYELRALPVRADDATVSCPECGTLNLVSRQLDGTHWLQQFDVGCIAEDGRKHSVPMVACSMSEAVALVRSDGHTIDPAMLEKPAEANAWDAPMFLSVAAGALSFVGCLSPFVGLLAMGLAGAAMALSKGRRGRGVLIFSAIVCALGVLARLWLKV